MFLAEPLEATDDLPPYLDVKAYLRRPAGRLGEPRGTRRQEVWARHGASFSSDAGVYVSVPSVLATTREEASAQRAPSLLLFVHSERLQFTGEDAPSARDVGAE
jgi:hypothetical protein